MNRERGKKAVQFGNKLNSFIFISPTSMGKQYFAIQIEISKPQAGESRETEEGVIIFEDYHWLPR